MLAQSADRLHYRAMAKRSRISNRVIVTADPAESAPAISYEGGRLSDLYHFLLTASWPMLLLGIVVAFAGLNAIFGIIYLLDHGIENARPGSFSDAFFFSVQTMATIGYGGMVPRTFIANLLVSVEALTGLIGLALVTGLVFAKFSRPTAKVRFSRFAVVARRDGVPSLMFRMANVRGNRIVDASAQVVFARQEKTAEGDEMRRFHDLKLQRYRNAIFNYSWTVIHPLNEDSPLSGESVESMERALGEIIVSVTGLDETFAQTVHARHSYKPRDIVWGARLADILERSSGGLAIDYSRFDDIDRSA
jgi:inward rectifier potassium channel